MYIDDRRVYKFRPGQNIKVNERFYRIRDLERMKYWESLGSVAAGATGTKEFNPTLQPRDDYLYFIEDWGIDGNCQFRLEFPLGQPHMFPRSADEYIDFDLANKLMPMYFPVIVKKPDYPAVRLYNPTGAANTSIMWIFGQKFYVDDITRTPPPVNEYIEMTDFPKAGNLGTA